MLDLRQLSPATPPLLPEISITWRGWLLFVSCGLFAAIGIYHQSWLFLGIGLTGWCVLLLQLLHFRLALAHGLEQVLIEGHFHPKEGQRFRAGREAVLYFSLRGANATLCLRTLKLHHSAYIKEIQPADQPPCPLSKGREWTHTFRIKTPVAGRFMLYGVELHLEARWALFRTFRYVHCPTPLRVLPLSLQGRTQRQLRPLQMPQHLQRGAPQRRIGSGSDLRDLRDYRPGDPRRLIAWKHSLRHRKLLCREFESEAPLTSYLLLDIGQSMREGTLGQRKLDYANEVVSAFACAAIEQRDSVGLITFDGKIFGHHKPATGQAQLHAMLRHLGELHQIVARDFAHLSLSGLCQLVGQHLWQEGILAGRGGRIPPSARQTAEFAWDYIHAHPSLSLPPSWESDQELIDTVLRSFCQDRGIEIPYRYHQWVTYKAAGLQESLEEATRQMHGGQLIIVLSDLGDILHWEEIIKSLKRARQRRHHVIFLSPFAPWFAPSPQEKKPEHKILRELLTLEQWAWRKRLQKLLVPLGIPLLSLDAATAPQALLERLRRLRISGRF